MKNAHPKRFALIGLPGSGKSTFASRLGKILDIPSLHLQNGWAVKSSGLFYCSCPQKDPITSATQRPLNIPDKVKKTMSLDLLSFLCYFFEK